VTSRGFLYGGGGKESVEDAQNYTENATKPIFIQSFIKAD
jgi:hypothetical protein